MPDEALPTSWNDWDCNVPVALSFAAGAGLFIIDLSKLEHVGAITLLGENGGESAFFDLPHQHQS